MIDQCVDEMTEVQLKRLLALQTAALHMAMGDAGPEVVDVLARARAYQAFLDAGSVGTSPLRQKLLDVAVSLGGTDDVVTRARALLRYVEEGT